MDDNNMFVRAGLQAARRPGAALSPPYPIGSCHSYVHRPSLLLKLSCSREESTRLPKVVNMMTMPSVLAVWAALKARWCIAAWSSSGL